MLVLHISILFVVLFLFKWQVFIKNEPPWFLIEKKVFLIFPTHMASEFAGILMVIIFL